MKTIKGKRFKISVADGYAVYEVVRVGPRKTTVRWVDDKEINPDGYISRVIGKKGSMDSQIVLTKVCLEEDINKSSDKNVKMLDSLEIGSIVHYHNGFNHWVRCEVVMPPKGHKLDDGQKCLKPIALLGDWKPRDLEWNAHYVKNIKNESLFRPHMSNIWKFHNPHKVNPNEMRPLELQEKPIEIEATLKITSGKINISVETVFNTETEKVTISPTVGGIMELLESTPEHYEISLIVENKKCEEFYYNWT
jgi:hypothetical protein